jgi:uncharacterized protein
MKNASKIVSALVLGAALGFSACSKAPDAKAPAPEPAVADGPQIGDKIGANASEAARKAADAERAETAAKTAADLAARGVTQIGWEDLMPPGEEERLAEMYQAQMALTYSITEGGAGDTGVQIGTFNTVKALNEKKVRLPGYTVPFEYGAKAEVSEFLLVPYFGACLHSPPPPPNQTVFVIADKPLALADLAQAVWIEGTIYTQTQESELADAAYTIKVTKIEKYEY